MNSVKSINDRLKLLCDRKIELLQSLVGIEEKFQNLVPNDNSSEEWLYSLSIQSLNDIKSVLDEEGQPRSRLGDLKKCKLLRKNSTLTLDELDRLESEIKITKIMLLQAKVDSLNLS